MQKNLARRGNKSGGGKQKPDITNPEVPGTGDGGDNGDNGDNGDGDTHNPDIANPETPPYIPDFE